MDNEKPRQDETALDTGETRLSYIMKWAISSAPRCLSSIEELIICFVLNELITVLSNINTK